MNRVMQVNAMSKVYSEALATDSPKLAVLWKHPSRSTYLKRVRLINADRAFSQALLEASEGAEHPPFTTPTALRQEAPPTLVGCRAALVKYRPNL